MNVVFGGNKLTAIGVVRSFKIAVPDDTSIYSITEFYVAGERKVLVEELSLASRR
jgi:hypothetical protein